TRPDETSIQSTEDLKGKTVAVQMGSTGHFAAADLPGVGRVDPYQFVDQAMTAVIIGAADAAILDELVAIEYMRAHPDAIKVVGEPFTTEEYGIAVRPQETELLAKINAALAELRASGRYDELYDKWFGVDSGPPGATARAVRGAAGHDLGRVLGRDGPGRRPASVYEGEPVWTCVGI